MIVLVDTGMFRVSIDVENDEEFTRYEIKPRNGEEYIRVDRETYRDALASARFDSAETTNMWLNYMLDQMRRSS